MWDLLVFWPCCVFAPTLWTVTLFQVSVRVCVFGWGWWCANFILPLDDNFFNIFLFDGIFGNRGFVPSWGCFFYLSLAHIRYNPICSGGLFWLLGWCTALPKLFSLGICFLQYVSCYFISANMCNFWHYWCSFSCCP